MGLYKIQFLCDNSRNQISAYVDFVRVQSIPLWTLQDVKLGIL